MPDWDVFQKMLESPLPANLRKVLDKAEERGWDPNPITLVMRMSKDSLTPFYLCWEWKEGKFRFTNARLRWERIGQVTKLTLRDSMLYMEHPEVIEETDEGSSTA